MTPAKDETTDSQTRRHPSTSTKIKTLMGVEIMTGGNIIMPIESSTLATTRSMTRKGRNNRKPI